MDAELVRNILLGTNIVLTLGMYVFNARDKKELATIASINRIEENANAKIQAQDVRIARIEEHKNHLLTHDDLGRVYDKLNEINRDLSSKISKSEGEIKHMFNDLSRLYDNELRKKSHENQ